MGTGGATYPIFASGVAAPPDGKPMDTRVITYGLRRSGFTLSGPNIEFFGD